MKGAEENAMADVVEHSCAKDEACALKCDTCGAAADYFVFGEDGAEQTLCATCANADPCIPTERPDDAGN